MTPRASHAYPSTVLAEFKMLAQECSLCYQCGACTSACPSGRELYRGPRRIVRLILAGDIEAVLKSDDLWRCTGCGTCSDVCRMEIDVADVLRRLRHLERHHGGAITCPERSAATIATARLQKQPRIDALQFGLSMAARGHLPKDRMGALALGLRLARQKLPNIRGTRRPRRSAGSRSGSWPSATSTESMAAVPFYGGCSLAQDHDLTALVHDVAAGFGVRLAEQPDTGCCGHPSRGAVAPRFSSGRSVCTACPACETALARRGVDVAPLWSALLAHAKQRGLGLQAAAPAFVPYVGCLADRDAALAGLDEAAQLAGARMRRSYPSLHSGCCGALGGAFRGATKASAMLLEFAVGQDAPVVSTCSLCCDNLRAAARELRRPVAVMFWPEFFRAAPTTPEENPQ